MTIASQYQQQNGQLVIQITERFDYSTRDEFRASYTNTDEIPKSYLIDLQHADYMDSSALGMLLLMKEYVGNNNVEIKIKPSTNIHKILDVATFQQMFVIKSPIV